MSATERKAVTFRLTAECRRLLIELAQERGISQAAVLELLLRDEARRQAKARKPGGGTVAPTQSAAADFVARERP